MTLLFTGIAIWVVVHLFKGVAPTARAGFGAALGTGPARGVIALLLVASVVLMVIGYRGADTTQLYDPFPGAGHLNNLLMLVAVMLMGAGSSRGKLRAALRHPMLTGVVVWGIAHLLVNGDSASVVLFGSMIVWALVEMMVINIRDGAWQRPQPGGIVGDIRLLIISLVIYAIFAGVHIWLGYNPFLGTY